MIESIKPLYSIVALISMAIQSSQEKQLMLNGISFFITKYVFPYYCKQENQAWKNSICHHLSIHKCFVKLSLKGGKNRSHYWMLDNQHEVMFEEGIQKKKVSPCQEGPSLFVNLPTSA